MEYALPTASKENLDKLLKQLGELAVDFNQCFDIESEWCHKYADLIIRFSNKNNHNHTKIHHIIPATYFLDILRLPEVRKVGTPDMVAQNLAQLSSGHHLLAHYYMSKCVKECVRQQMLCAFRLMYDTIDPVSEEYVSEFAKEMDSWYNDVKNIGPYIPKNPRVKKIYDPNNRIFYHVFDHHRFTMSIKQDGKMVNRFTWQNFRLMEITDGGYFTYHRDAWGESRNHPSIIITTNGYDEVFMGKKHETSFSNEWEHLLENIERFKNEFKIGFPNFTPEGMISRIISAPDFIKMTAPEGYDYFMDIESDFIEQASAVFPTIEKYIYPEIPDIPERFRERIIKAE